MDERQRLELIVEAVKYCQRVKAMGMPPSSYSKALREPIWFLWECRHEKNKDRRAKYRSKATLGLRRGSNELCSDHAVPFIYLQTRLLAIASPEPDSVRALLNDHGLTVIITKDEDTRLNQAGLRRTMPKDWDGRDPLARYRALGIELLPNI